MSKSSRKRRKNQRGVVAALLIILVFACIGMLIIAGYDVNACITAYAVIATIASVVLYLGWRQNYEFANNQNLRNSKLRNENADLIRENSSLKISYRTDYNNLIEQMLVIDQQKKVADRSAKVYRKRSMESEEILEKLKKDYPEIEAVIVAYKAEIEQTQQAAKKISEEIKSCISAYKECNSVEELQKACSLYLGLSAKEKKWLPEKKRIKQEITSLIEKIREEEAETKESETDDESDKNDSSVSEEESPEPETSEKNECESEDMQQQKISDSLEETSES